jgi:hypothetical protein
LKNQTDPSATVKFTLVTKSSGPLTKIIRYKNSQLIKDVSECWLSEGTSQEVTTSLKGFAESLRSCKPNQALIHGISGHKEVKIVSERNFKGQYGTITRTKKFFKYPKKNALCLFDYDFKPGMKSLSHETWLKIMSGAVPGFEQAGYVLTPSTSACLYDKGGRQLAGGGYGFHHYCIVLDPADTQRFNDVLFKRLWLAGYGYIFVSRSGAQLERTIYDQFVMSPERLDFVAGAVCRDGLEQRLPDPVYRAGDVLDTRLLPSLTKQEESEFKHLVEQAKQNTQNKADTVWAEYLKTEAPRLAKRLNVSQDEARKILSTRVCGKLISTDILEFDNGGFVGVEDILKKPEKYHLKTLRDPVEPEQGKYKAKLFANNDKTIIINSCLHGGKAYRLQAVGNSPGQDDRAPNIAENTVKYLASLSPFEYERQRQSMAEKLGLRVSILDQEVEKLRKANNPEKAKSLVEELEAWPEPVSGSELLDTIYQVALDYVIMPENSAVAFSLWTLLTYSYNAFRILPVLGIISPEKRCGKTRLIDVLSGLAYRAFPSCNLTPATVYRVIEKCRPCFLIDEADTFLPNNDELRGVLNSGHSVKNAFVTRINPDTMEPERFSTWCPKAIALIGRLSGQLSTLNDRSILIGLKRKLLTEKVKRLDLDFDIRHLDLRRKCLRWASDNMDRLQAANPQMPSIDNDRALDNWLPLFAIADLAGGEWPEKAQSAMVTIEAGKEDDSANVILLQDIKKVFDNCGYESLWTQNLIEALVKMEDRPWSEWKKGKPLSAASLSKLLKPFEIKSVQLKKDGKNKNGYKLKHFKDAFERYAVPPHTSDRDSTPLPSANHEAFREDQDSTSNKKVELKNSLKPAPIAKGRGVEPWNEGTGGEDIKTPELPPKQPDLFNNPPDDPEQKESSDSPAEMKSPPEDDQGREVIEL